MNNLIFNGHDFSALFVVGNIVQQIANPTAELVEVPGRDGAALRDVKMGALEISADIVCLASTEGQRRQDARTLASWLAVDSAKQLRTHDDGSLYYMAVPNGPVQYQRLISGGKATVTFIAIEPAAYGETRTATVPSGGSVTITVNGTYPTLPTFYASAAVRDSSSSVWGIRHGGGNYIHIPTGSSASRRVDIDCGKRVATITASRTVVLPTLDSDWIALNPGQNTLSNDKGTGACTVTWTERWL